MSGVRGEKEQRLELCYWVHGAAHPNSGLGSGETAKGPKMGRMLSPDAV